MGRLQAFAPTFSPSLHFSFNISTFFSNKQGIFLLRSWGMFCVTCVLLYWDGVHFSFLMTYVGQSPSFKWKNHEK